ncbi:MAG TPA: aldo/keto reductase [Casimicrobiaceae bacterium]|nr:aldo/keto reductase [Casimicrobiaceae bacterium]
MSRDVPRVQLPDGSHACALGIGTWRMGEQGRSAAREVAALSLALDLGMTLIDTAEMYGEGGAEKIVAQAIAGRRDEVFLVSKVYPHNAGRKRAIAACERSLKRLRTDRLDLYLLHWRGSVPLAETVAAFEQLQREGKIARWGVSNFDVADMEELFAIEGGSACATNQVLYHMAERGIEYALLPWLRARGIPVMAYSPLGQGDLVTNRKLKKIAADLGVAPATLLLAWLVRQGDIIAIPQSSDPAHIRINRAAAALELNKMTLAAIDAAFPPPSRSTPLAMI